QAPHQRGEPRDVELKDEREPDDDRLDLPGGPHEELFVGLEVAGHDRVPVLPQRRGEVAQAKVALMLKADQQHWLRGVAWPVQSRLVLQNRERRSPWHNDSFRSEETRGMRRR